MKAGVDEGTVEVTRAAKFSRAWEAIVKTLTFLLRELGSYWRHFCN